MSLDNYPKRIDSSQPARADYEEVDLEEEFILLGREEDHPPVSPRQSNLRQSTKQQRGIKADYAFILPMVLKFGIILAFVYGLSLIISPELVAIVTTLVGLCVLILLAGLVFWLLYYVARIILTIIGGLLLIFIVGLVLKAILSGG